jgi:hypothetical protein
MSAVGPGMSSWYGGCSARWPALGAFVFHTMGAPMKSVPLPTKRMTGVEAGIACLSSWTHKH